MRGRGRGRTGERRGSGAVLHSRCMVRVVATSNPPKAIMGFHFHSFSLSFFFCFAVLAALLPLSLPRLPHHTPLQVDSTMRICWHTHTHTGQFGYRQQTTLAAWRPQNPLHKTRTSLMAAPRSQPRPNLLILPSLLLIYPSNRSDAVPGPSNTHMARLSSWQPIMGTHMRM